jgi:FkbM family methyltransferase
MYGILVYGLNRILLKNRSKLLIPTLKFILSHPLSHGTEAKTILRFFRWQLATRTLNLPMVVPFINDTRLIAERGITSGPGNFYVGLLEYEEMMFSYHYVKRGDVFFDIGANIGTYSILVANHCHVVAIEPIHSTYQRLIDNIHLNRMFDQIKALNVGIGSEKGQARFTDNLDTTNHVLQNEISNGCLVEIFTLDDIARNEGTPEFIKMDVEGYEGKIIEGGDKTLSSVDGPNVLLVELRGHGVRYGLNEEDIHQRILSYGFQPYMYDPCTRDIKPWCRKSKNKLGDMLYIRNVEKARKRVVESPAICINGQMI